MALIHFPSVLQSAKTRRARRQLASQSRHKLQFRGSQVHTRLWLNLRRHRSASARHCVYPSYAKPRQSAKSAKKKRWSSTTTTGFWAARPHWTASRSASPSSTARTRPFRCRRSGSLSYYDDLWTWWTRLRPVDVEPKLAALVASCHADAWLSEDVGGNQIFVAPSYRSWGCCSWPRARGRPGTWPTPS